MLMQLRKWLFLGLALTVTGLWGCAEEVDDIDRVSTAGLRFEKSWLEGEWYFRQTVVDAPPTVGLLFDGIESKVEKVRFEIRENELIAVRVHESIPGIEQDARLPGAEIEGSPVMSWPITSHYDVIRDYNRTTGEQGNVLTTDSEERPWYERDYMTVNWSLQHHFGPATDLDFFVGLISGFLGNQGQTGYSVDHDFPEDPDHMQVDDGLLMYTKKWPVSYWITCAIEHGTCRG